MLPHPDFQFIASDGAFDATRLAHRTAQLAEQVADGTLQLVAPSALDVIAAVALDGVASTIELVPAGVQPDGVDSSVGQTRWVIFTSGSTGEPIAITHTLESLARSVSQHDGPRTWGLVYDPARLAGFAVVLQALATGSTLVDARTGSIMQRVDTMRDAGVDALSATPTLWRQILQSGHAENWPLTRVTLGGEVADQLILDALRRQFPAARVTHIFAASETGVAFAVSDGLEGFPEAFLHTPPRGVQLAVRDDLLWIHNPGSSAAGDDGFAPTGDVVSIAESRVRFEGRLSGMANVGGTKVFPEQVERELREHPGVADAVVIARRSPFAGQILVARVTAVDPAAGTTFGGEVRRWLGERLSRPMIPATIEVVDDLGSSSNGKVVRHD